MTNKILTIGIAAYNMEKYLERCLDSIVCIEHIDDIEIIVVNDGSKDKTIEIARAYESKYPLSVRAIDKPNGGWGSVVNLAMKEAKGKYFRLLDADDWYDSDNFNKFVEYLKHSDSDLVLTPYQYEFLFEGKSKAVPFTNVEYNNQYNYKDLTSLNWGKKWFDLPSITYKTSILQDNNIKVSECFYADIEYDYLPITHIKTFVFNELSIYRYFIGREGQSVSKEGATKHYDDHLRITKQAILYYKSKANDNCDSVYVEFLHRVAVAKIILNYQTLMKFYIRRDEANVLLKEFDEYLNNESRKLYIDAGNAMNFGGIIYPIILWRKLRFNIFNSLIYKLIKR